MPEMPDVTVYVEALASRIAGQPLVKLRLASPFMLRTFEPPAAELAGKTVTDVRRMGKRIVIDFEGDLFVIIHHRRSKISTPTPWTREPGSLYLSLASAYLTAGRNADQALWKIGGTITHETVHRLQGATGGPPSMLAHLFYENDAYSTEAGYFRGIGKPGMAPDPTAGAWFSMQATCDKTPCVP